MITDIDKINNRIKATGLKKTYVAQLANVSLTHLSYVLNGHKPLSLSLKLRLFAVLGIS